MKKNHYIFLLTLLLFVISCKKNDCANPNVVDGINTTELPPATMTGANTMGCLINGEVWLPLSTNILGDLGYDITFSVSGLDEGGGVYVKGRGDYINYNNIISLLSEDVIEIGTYDISPLTLEYVDFQDECGIYDLDSNYTNFMEITRLDFDEEIVSGLFEMRVILESCDTITMTEGRFDLSP